MAIADLVPGPIRRMARPLRRLIRYVQADRYTRRYNWAGGNYRWIMPILARSDVTRANGGSLILEIGSRDCLDAIDLYRHFSPAMVYAFEPSRPGLRRCLEILGDFPDVAPSIMLCGFALGETSGTAAFYEFTLKEKASGHVNIGASSLYPWTSRNHRNDDAAKGIEDRTAVQQAYRVPVFRADDLAFLKDQRILLIAMDVEGAELAVLKGAASILNRTRFLCLEAGYHLPREGAAADARDLVDHLVAGGWELLACSATETAQLPEDPGYLTQFDLLFRNGNNH